MIGPELYANRGERGLIGLAYLEAIRDHNTVNFRDVVNAAEPLDIVCGLVAVSSSLIQTFAISSGVDEDAVYELLRAMFLVEADGAA